MHYILRQVWLDRRSVDERDQHKVAPSRRLGGIGCTRTNETIVSVALRAHCDVLRVDRRDAADLLESCCASMARNRNERIKLLPRR